MLRKRNPISCACITACNASVLQHVAALVVNTPPVPWEIEWIVLPQIFCLTAGAQRALQSLPGRRSTGKGSLLELLVGDPDIGKVFERSRFEALIEPETILGCPVPWWIECSKIVDTKPCMGTRR